MRSDVHKELIQIEMDTVLEAVTEAEAGRRRMYERTSTINRAPSGVDLRQIQRELYNEDNAIVLTALTDTIVRDRLNRLIEGVRLFKEKMGREVIYMTPDTYLAIKDYKESLVQRKIDREDRVEQLAAGLGYPVNWYINAPFRSRQDTVVMKIDDLEAIAQKI